MAEPTDEAGPPTAAKGGLPRSDAAEGRAGPAGDLGEVWDLLDALPPVPARLDLAATTVDLVAARLDGGGRPPAAAPPALIRWVVPALAVAASLAGGLVAGRMTAPDPDRTVLENLPLIEHVDLLQEAGSVAFLEALADRMAARQGQPPRWLRFGRDPEALRDEARDFDEAIASLIAAGGRGGDERLLAARRQEILALPAADRSRLARAVESFEELSRIERRDLHAVARVIADPADDRLRNAARLWHVIVAATPPPMRRGTIEMGTDDRLEWLDRFETRPANRRRDDGRDRGPGPPREPPRDGRNGPRRSGWPPGRPPPLREEPSAGRPPGFRPAGPPPAAGRPEVPAETPAPPG